MEHITKRYANAFYNIKPDLAQAIKPVSFLEGLKTEEFVLPELPPIYYALVMGAAHKTKQLPVNLLQSVIDHLTLPVVLVGGNDDVENAKRLIGALITDVTGKLSIAESALVLSKAKAVLAGDTGMMHIAASIGVPLVVLWGNTVPQFGMGPYHPHPYNVKQLDIELPCRPCGKIGFNKCPLGHHACMQHSPKAIVDALKSVTSSS